MTMWLLLALAGCDPCAESGAVCTVAGDGHDGTNGDGRRPRDTWLYYPLDVAWRPGTDLVYVVDWNNEKIRELGPRVRTVVGADEPGDGAPDDADLTEAGAPGATVALNHPVQLDWAPDGRLYIAAWHNHKVRSWDPAADRVRVVAGGGEGGNGADAGYAGDGGPATKALLRFPSSLAFAPDGTMWIVDEMNLVLRRVDPDGTIHTACGCGDPGFLDGAATTAAFAFPDDPDGIQPRPGGAITWAEGAVYVADTYNHAVRRYDPTTGLVTTVAGTGEPGFEDGDAARFHAPTDLALGPDGRLYVADSLNHAVRAIDLEVGTVETIVGTGDPGDAEDGAPALAAGLDHPWGLDFDGDGALLIADTFNSKIRRVTP